MNTSNPMIIKSLLRQQNDLLINYPEGVKIKINTEDYLDIQADILGPIGTPYEDGIFKVVLVISNDFPNSPPKGYFNTKIFHPNVSTKGEICVNTLKKDWNSKQWSLYHVFQVKYHLMKIIRCLLIVPFPESSLNEEAGRLFQDNYQEYFKLARLYTTIHSLNTVGDSIINNKKLLNENNNRTNIKNNEFLNKDQDKLSINLTKDLASDIIIDNNSSEIKKHSRSLYFNERISSNFIEIEEKINLNSFSLYRANSLKVNNSNNNSKSKQDEIKKWLSRI